MLHELARKHGTDKYNAAHTFNNKSYIDVYALFFSEIREMPMNVLEIGVLNGSSLRMWRDFFPNSNIYGLDIDPRCKEYESDRIQIKIGSQDDISLLSSEFKDIEFDIIIDDGSHVNEHIIKTFNYLFFQKLKNGGFYCIEDLECSYCKLQTDFDVYTQWSGMNFNKDKNFDNNRNDINNVLFNIIRQMDFKKGSCQSMHFYSQQCIIKKI